MTKTFNSLEQKILEAVRAKAQEIPIFKETGNGAIRILAYPFCPGANQWLGGKGEIQLDENGMPILIDVPDYETTYCITPSGNRTAHKELEGIMHLVNCYAYSAMKIAHCARADHLNIGLKSGLKLHDIWMIETEEENDGYAPYAGAICVKVIEEYTDPTIKLKSRLFCYIYVSVSGADPKDDEKCSMAAIPVIKDFFEKEGSEPVRYTFITPED